MLSPNSPFDVPSMSSSKGQCTLLLVKNPIPLIVSWFSHLVHFDICSYASYTKWSSLAALSKIAPTILLSYFNFVLGLAYLPYVSNYVSTHPLECKLQW